MAFSDSKPHYALLNRLCGVACTHRVTVGILHIASSYQM